MGSIGAAGSAHFYDTGNNTYSNVSIPAACYVSSDIVAIGGYQSAYGSIMVVRQFSPGLLYQISASAPAGGGSRTAQQPPTASQAGLYTVYHIGSGDVHLTTDFSW